MRRELLIPLRDGPNEELRYALRSFHVNHRPAAVITAGGRPTWLTNTSHVLVDQAPNQPHRNVIRNLRILLEVAGTDQVIIANDDTFVVQPLTELPRLHRGSLIEYASGLDPHTITARQVDDTIALLQRHGVPDPLLYELHVPAVYDRRALIGILDLIAVDMYARPPHRVAQILWATVYGNLILEYEGERAGNAKVYTPTPLDPWPTPFLSTNDDTFTDGAAGVYIRSLFLDPSPYER